MICSSQLSCLQFVSVSLELLHVAEDRCMLPLCLHQEDMPRATAKTKGHSARVAAWFKKTPQNANKPLLWPVFHLPCPCSAVLGLVLNEKTVCTAVLAISERLRQQLSFSRSCKSFWCSRSACSFQEIRKLTASKVMPMWCPPTSASLPVPCMIASLTIGGEWRIHVQYCQFVRAFLICSSWSPFHSTNPYLKCSVTPVKHPTSTIQIWGNRSSAHLGFC